MTTLPTDPVDNTRHTITNVYNPDGTLQRRTDQLGHITSYTYDDYRRVKSVTPPDRGGTHTTSFYYDANGTGDDYKYPDSNATYVTLPSLKRTKTLYDDNRRKSSVTVGYGTSDAATTSYGYDNAGNLRTTTNPLNHNNLTTIYDERNRPSSISVGGQTTAFTYDTAGRRKTITRPNGQVITYDTFDAMNRVLQQTATQSPDPDAVTKYAYYAPGEGPVGLLKTMQDPRLVAMNSAYKYTYGYDNMGRKTSVQYPPDSLNQQRTEQWAYDTVGRLQTFINRNQKTQTFSYDALNRMNGFTWNDNGLTPSVSFGYDAASRVTSVTNANASVSRAYFNDNLLQSETESITGGSSKTVTYSYDADGNRASLQYPSNSYSFTYAYSGRNQLQSVLSGNTPLATYGYNADGDMISRSVGLRGSSSYTYDALDRVTHVEHSFSAFDDPTRPTPTPRPPPSPDTRTLDYDYDNVGNRKWTKRDGGNGDVFGYDYADQVTAVKLNIPNPDTTAPGGQTIVYDANGNRTSFAPYGSTDTYATNNLNQYTSRNNINTAYDNNGNLVTGVDGSSYTYDAQNRLTSAYKSGTTETFKYDGLNRQVSRTIGTSTTYNVYDGWGLIGEYQSGTLTAAYLSGAGGLVKNLVS